MNRARVKKLVFFLVVLAVVIQFLPPKPTNPPVDKSKTLEVHLQVPPQVDAILNRSCKDCHSNRTVWPWYAHVAPFSWVVVDDVNRARVHFNLSDWTVPGDPPQMSRRLDLMCKETQQGFMPPITYWMVHRKAKLSSEDIKVLCSWARSVAASMGGQKNKNGP
jgi:Haem-binding domain